MKANKKLLVVLLAVVMVIAIATIGILVSRPEPQPQPQPQPTESGTVVVTFYNGSEVYETVSVEKGSTLTLPKAPKAEKGKGLAGWTTIDGDIEEVIDPATFVVNKDLSLYALWADVYTVTINSDNGTPFVVKEVFAGSVIEQPEDPIKEGFRFVEWRDALAEKAYDFSQPIYGNLILKAMYGDGAPNRVSDTKWDFSTGVHGSWIGAQGGWNYEINGLPAKEMVYQTTEDGYAAWGFTLTDSLDNIPVIDGNNEAGLGMKYIYNEGISVPASKAKLVVVYLKPKYYSIDMATSPNDQFRISVLTSNGGMIYGYGSGSEAWSLRTDAGSKNMIQVDNMEDGWIRVQFKIHELDVWSEDAIIKGMAISFVQRKATPVMDIISFKSIELLDQEEFIDPHEIDYVTNTEWDMSKEEDSRDWFGVMSAGVDTNSVKTTINADGTKFVYANTNKWRGMVMNTAKIDISKTSGILAVTMDISGMNPTNYRVYIVTDKGGDLYKNSGRDDVSCYYAVTSATDLSDGWTVRPNADGTITVYYDLTKLEYWTSATELQSLSFVTVDGTSNGTVIYKSVSLVDTVEKRDCATEGHLYKDATCVEPKTCAACGETKGKPAGHSWTDATCTAPKTCSVCGVKEGAAKNHEYADGVCSVCGAAEAATVNKNQWHMSSVGDAADWDAYHAMKLNEALSTKVTEAGLEVTFGGAGNGWKGIVLDNAAIDISKLTGKLSFTYSCADMDITQYRIYVLTDKGGHLLNNSTASGYTPADYYIAAKVADVAVGSASGWAMTYNADGSITVTFDLKELPFYAEGTELRGLTICTITANQTTGKVIFKAIELEAKPIENDCATEGHIFKDATCLAPKTCVACGATEGQVADHNWMDATCAAPKTCSVCGKTKGEALSHTWTEATCAAPKTCSVCGATKGEALGHNYAGGACVICGERYVWDLSNATHAADWDAYLSKKKHEQLTTTVTNKGLEVTFKHENNWRAIVLEEATLQISKLTGKLTFTYSTDLPMLNYRIHLVTELGGSLTNNGVPGVNYVDVSIANVKAGSVPGWTQTTNADGSVTVTVDLTTLSDFVNGTVLKGLTICTVSEKAKDTAITYKSVELEAVPSDHNCQVDGHIFKEATCTAPKTCSVCGATEGQTAGHSWVDATCTTAKTCSVCGKTEGEALGHTWVDATCAAPKTCATCGLKEGAAVAHNFVDGACVTCGASEASFVTQNKWELNDVDDAADWDAYHAMKLNEALTSVVTNNGLEVTFSGGGNGWKGIVLDNAAINTSKLTGKLSFTYSCADMNITSYRVYILTEKGGNLLNNKDAVYAAADYYVTVKISDIEAGTATAWTKTTNADGSITVTFDLSTIPFYAEGTELRGLTICTVTANSTTGKVTFKSIELEALPIDHDCQTEGHIFKAATCTTPKTCSVCGATEGQTAGHSWKTATCTDPKTCAVCGTTEGVALGHTWTAATCQTPKTCATCGAKEGATVGHNFVEGVCSVCGTSEASIVTQNKWDMTNAEDAADWDAYHAMKLNEALTSVVTNNGLEITFGGAGNGWKGIVLDNAAIDISKLTGKLSFTYSCADMDITQYRVYIVTDKGGHLTNNNVTGLSKDNYYVAVKIADIEAGTATAWTKTVNADGSITVTFDLKSLPFYAEGTELKGLTICTVTANKVTGTVTYKSVELEAVPSDHNCQVDGHIFKAATCTAPKTCSVCGATEGAALGHTWTAATCINPKSCSVCGTTEGEALGHTWTAATCTTPKTCSVCGATEGELAEHSWVDATCTAPKTCVVCGATEGYVAAHTYVNGVCAVCGAAEDAPVVHTWVDATCTTPKTCTVCGATEGEPLGHTWADATCTVPKTCSVCGETEGEALGHNWADATCTAPKTCVACGATEGAKTNHNFVNGVCSDCGAYPITQNIWDLSNATDAAHWDAYHAMKYHEALTSKITEAGLEVTFGGAGNGWKGIVLDDAAINISKLTGKLTFTYSCADMAITQYRVYILTDKGGHLLNNNVTEFSKDNYYVAVKIADIVDGKATAWTMTTNDDGSITVTFDLKTLPFYAEGTELKGLSICTITANSTTGTVIYQSVELEEIPDGYNCEVDGHIFKDATCTAPKTCSACGATEGEALGHTWTDATCVAPKTCSACGETEGEALGHTWVDATCVAPKTCATCGATEGSAVAHNFVDGACTFCGNSEASFVMQNKWDLSNADDAADWDAYHAMKLNEKLVTKITEAGLEVTFEDPGNGWKGIVLDNAAINTSKLTGKLTFTYSCADMAISQYRIYILTEQGGHLTNNNVTGLSKDNYYVTVKIADIEDGKATAWTMTTNADGSITVTFDLTTLPFYAEGVELRGLTICTVTANKTTGTVIYKSVELEKKPHNCQVDGHIFEDATCTAPKTCSVCGATEGEALGHSWVDATCTAPKTCSRCGETEGEALGHIWNDATCTTPKTCSVCNTTEGEALGHDWIDATCTAPKSCGHCGATEGEALGHDWDDATCTTPKTCSVCHATEGEALGHSYTNYTYNNDATCETDGTETATCDNGCGEKHTRTAENSALGHSFTNYFSNGDAKCGIDGTKTAKCDHHCGTEDTVTDVGSALEHVFTDYESNNDATCTENGTETAICERGCGETHTRTAENSALGHSFTDYQSNGDATCTEDGTKTAKCDRCDETNTVTDVGSAGHVDTVKDNICDRCGESLCVECVDVDTDSDHNCDVCGSKVGDHTYTSTVTDPTCTEKGYTTYTCNCGDTYTGNEVPALNHSFTNYQSNGDATCEVDGTKTAKCDRCDETNTVTDVGSAHGHDYEGVVTTDPKCTEPGVKTYTCKHDASHTYTEPVDALGHDWVDADCDTPKTCSRCGAEEGEALGHVWMYATCIAPKTCSVCGEIEGEALGHDWADATCTDPKTCSRCSLTEGEALGHSYTNYTYNNDATCEADGTETATCDNGCGEKHTRTAENSALGHSYDADVTEPTCTEGGYTTYTCHCGDTYVADETAALGHSWNDATCTVPKTCSRCFAIEGKKLGHKDADKNHICDVCEDNMLVWDMTNVADASDWFNAQSYTATGSDITTSEVTSDGFKVNYYHKNGWKGIVLKDVEIDIAGFAGILSFTYTEEMDITQYRVHVLTDLGGDLGSNTSGTPANYYAAINLTAIAGNDAWTRTENADGSVTVTFDLTTLLYFAEGTVLKGMDIVTVTATGTTGTVTYKSIELVRKAHDCQVDGHIFEDATCTTPKTCSVCRDTEGEALGHNYEGGACTGCGERYAWDLSDATHAADWDAYINKQKESNVSTEVTEDGMVVTFGHTNNWRAIVLEEATLDISKFTGKLTFTYSTDLTISSYRIHLVTDKGGSLTTNGTVGTNHIDTAKGYDSWTKTVNADGSVTVTFDLSGLSDFVNGTMLKGLTICTVSENAKDTTITYKSVELEKKAHDCQVDGHVWTDATCTAPKTCSVCRDTEGEALGHNYEGGACTVCGERYAWDLSNATHATDWDAYCNRKKNFELTTAITANGLEVTFNNTNNWRGIILEEAALDISELTGKLTFSYTTTLSMTNYRIHLATELGGSLTKNGTPGVNYADVSIANITAGKVQGWTHTSVTNEDGSVTYTVTVDLTTLSDFVNGTELKGLTILTVSSQTANTTITYKSVELEAKP